jgi:hypothetical protein
MPLIVKEEKEKEEGTMRCCDIFNALRFRPQEIMKASYQK